MLLAARRVFLAKKSAGAKRSPLEPFLQNIFQELTKLDLFCSIFQTPLQVVHAYTNEYADLDHVVNKKIDPV